jgi:hypothetical protein
MNLNACRIEIHVLPAAGRFIKVVTNASNSQRRFHSDNIGQRHEQDDIGASSMPFVARLLFDRWMPISDCLECFERFRANTWHSGL